MELSPEQWIVNANTAKQLIESDATVLDVRNKITWRLGHLPKARCINWQQFSQKTIPNKGKLLDNSQVLAQLLRHQGISNHQPVIVVGNPSQAFHFGEEGRIVWMLHTLGHSQAAFVDGGQQALVNAGVELEMWGSKPQKAGDFTINRTDHWEIQADQLQSSLANSQNLIILDNREAREYAGATPYGEKRGGHIPRAIHFYFKELLQPNGYLLSCEQINSLLNQLGIEKGSNIITYCTGGIRSAFFVAVLVSLGYNNSKNYTGSMWEWSQAEPSSHPLVN
ncbi:sulfurtransferase [Synechocystis sp. PCC 7509]|uniref:sulfurtransferase n=1 Tax=Synechocystis sp. PCC 7509 TaxID=927677 RepID=UPI0002AC0FCD|nr:rhodanese-like domain-containing protein [Synechocystis sp. PCC 7509]